MTTFAPSRRKCFGDDLAQSLAAAGDERVNVFKFHLRRVRRKDARRRAGLSIPFPETGWRPRKSARASVGSNVRPIGLTEIAAIGANHGGVRAIQGVGGTVDASETAVNSSGRLFHRRIKRAHDRARGQQLLAQLHRRAAPERVGVGGISQAEHGDGFAAQIAETRLQPPERPAAMQIVALFDGGDDGNLFAFRRRPAW